MAAVTVDPSHEPSPSSLVGTRVHGVAGANTPSQKLPSLLTKDDQFVAYLPALVSSSDSIKSMDAISTPPPPPLRMQADSSLPSNSKIEINKLQDQTGGVTSRPCILRPGTITADPKVQFLLLAKSQSEDGLEDATDQSFSGEGSSIVTTMDVEQQVSTYQLAATGPSIFRESGAFMGHHEKGNDEEWMNTKPLSVYPLHDS
jgi:hypothetical protein